MYFLRAAVVATGMALLLGACAGGSENSEPRTRYTSAERVKSIRSIDWTIFQQALHMRYGEKAEAASSGGESDFFVDRAFTASYGGYLLPEELEEQNPPTDEATILAAARDRLLNAYDKRARVIVPNPSASAQANFDCWLYKASHGGSDSDIEQCKIGFADNMEQIEAALAPKPKGSIILLDGKVLVGDAVLDERCDEMKLDTKDRSNVKMDGTNCEMDDNMSTAVAALPKAPKIFTLYYNTDEVLPTADSSADLEELAGRIIENIQSRQHREVMVSGHADRQGSENYNMTLSENRAITVRDRLIERGVDSDSIQVEWFGESQNAVDTEDGVAESANRRVEILVR